MEWNELECSKIRTLGRSSDGVRYTSLHRLNFPLPCVASPVTEAELAECGFLPVFPRWENILRPVVSSAQGARLNCYADKSFFPFFFLLYISEVPKDPSLRNAVLSTADADADHATLCCVGVLLSIIRQVTIPAALTRGSLGRAPYHPLGACLSRR